MVIPDISLNTAENRSRRAKQVRGPPGDYLHKRSVYNKHLNLGYFPRVVKDPRQLKSRRSTSALKRAERSGLPGVFSPSLAQIRKLA